MKSYNDLEATFNQLVSALMSALEPGEHLTVQLSGEDSQFARFNNAKVRQTGCVSDGQLELTLMADQRTSFREVPFTGDGKRDWQQAQAALEDLRQEVPTLPVDPYLVLPEGSDTTQETHRGTLLAPDEAVSAILPTVAGLDFTGIYSSGLLLRGYADSAGRRHWFATDAFSLDYSLFLASGQAVKGTFAGSEWNQADYEAKLADSKRQLTQLDQTPKTVERGNYRTYLAPAAVAEILTMFSWGGVSEAAIQRGGSAFAALHRGEKQLSPQFNLSENFQHGLVPRFNELGEVAPVELPIIAAGKLVNTLISSRTAKEYGKVSNGASAWEGLRSPEILPGTLAPSDILAALDTGLYVSNLHYLNWSDRTSGRITGMTRYACFWVENGKIVAPIENLRFDESLYRCFGEHLLELTTEREFIPEVGTYGRRELGGMWMPGILADQFTYTL